MIRRHRPRVRGWIPALAAILALAVPVGCGDLAGLPPLDEPIAGETLVTTRADLENLRGIRVIHGDLTILPPAWETIPDLEPLGALEQVRGALEISGVTGLRNLSGMIALRTVSSLRVRDNPDLESLAGATALTEIQGELEVERNPKLTDLSGLSNLAYVRWLDVSGNAALTSLTGIEEALVRPSEGPPPPSIYLTENAQLTDLSALAGIPRWRTIHIRSNETLRDLGPLAGVTWADRLALGGPTLELGAASFPQLDSCDECRLVDLPTVRSFEFLGTASVQRVEAHGTGLESVEGLATVRDLRSLRLEDNAFLADISAVASVDSLDFLALWNNDALLSLAPLSGIRIGDVSINDCDGLEDLQGLEGLDAVEGVVNITFNVSLASLRGLENLQSAYTCRVRWNPSLCDTLVTEWMNGLDLRQAGDQRGNRRCRRPTDGAEPPSRP